VKLIQEYDANSAPFPFLQSEASTAADFIEENPAGADSIDQDSVVSGYLSIVKEKLSRDLKSYGEPQCYKEGQFWVRPKDAYFAMREDIESKSPNRGLNNPNKLYHPEVFVWLPQCLDKHPLACVNKQCKFYQDSLYPLMDKGWNTDPVARRIVGMVQNYYIITKRVWCKKDQKIKKSAQTVGIEESSDDDQQRETGGCGMSWQLYDPEILQQLNPGLVEEFPAFLTHRSGIDKKLMALIRAGVASRVSTNAWSNILRELHVREHDLHELKYLYGIQQEERHTDNRNTSFT
jgi:hypothetical protein